MHKEVFQIIIVSPVRMHSGGGGGILWLSRHYAAASVRPQTFLCERDNLKNPCFHIIVYVD